jgi:hypothetical protein
MTQQSLISPSQSYSVGDRVLAFFAGLPGGQPGVITAKISDSSYTVRLDKALTTEGQYGSVFDKHVVNLKPGGLAAGHMNADLGMAPTRPEPQPILTFADGFRADLQGKKPKYYGQAASWAAEGLCPHCGEKGRFSMSQAVCSQHGPY